MVPNGAARLNERPVWSEASNNGNGENGRKADLTTAPVGVPLRRHKADMLAA